MKHICLAVFTLAAVAFGSGSAAAQTLAPQERLCDPTFEDCRADILTYIRQETVAIDMGFWMMGDARYSNELVKAHQRGVRIRLLMDPRCGPAHPSCLPQIDQLAEAGIPMRNRRVSGILHWKAILFEGQGQVEFSGANYSPFELRPEEPYVNFTDEIVYFSNDPSIVQSFMTKFDDLWTSTTEFADYANVTEPLTRRYATYPIDPELNFPPEQSFRNRSTAAYNAEKQKIDVLMFRITDERHTDAIIAAVNRGIPVRLITDHTEYRNRSRLWNAYNVDKLYAAGVQVRFDGHQGINHAKGVVLYSQGLSIFGSSNWTSPSTNSQREHNYFTKKPWIFTWMVDLFDRKWNNSTGFTETAPFVPLPPDRPSYTLPADAAAGVATTGVTLTWNGGLWAHKYDIYFGTSSNPPLLAADVHLGPSQSATDYRKYTLPMPLQEGTTYYWKVVSKTMASVASTGQVWSFTTAGTPPVGNQAPTVSIASPANGSAFADGADITLTADAADSDGTVARVDFRANGTIVGSATAAPYSVTWNDAAAGTYDITAIATDDLGASTTSGGVSITVGEPPPTTLPDGWGSQDIGATGATGSASFSNGTFTVTGAGADIWGTADAFQFAYRQMTGDGSIVARVATVQNTAAWFKGGVMIRSSLSPSAAHAFMLASWSKGMAYQRRVSDGNASASTSGSASTAPRWVKLTRAGSRVTASESADGSTWTDIRTLTIALGETVYVGLAVSSHLTGVLGTATFDNVAVTTASAANAAPTVALTSPANGVSLPAPAAITLTADASDSDGTVARVDFYSGGTAIGSASTAPWSFTWSGVPAGTYSLTAVATDDDGAAATSAAVAVTVTSATPQNAPPTVALTSPSNGASAQAPAAVTLAATAGDSDGSVARVDFYAGAALIGSSTAAPYSFDWTGVPAGAYSLTAVATDDAGAATRSQAVSFTVNEPAPSTDLPEGWESADIGAVPFAGASTFTSGTYTVTGSGADIWNDADAFHFAYRTLTGDGTVVARVATVQNADKWTKAGVMIRADLTAGSAHAFMLVSPGKGLAFQRRPVAGGASVHTAGALATAPRWVRLTRTGDLFEAYESVDGVAWTLVGADTIPMGATVQVGLAVTSHTTARSATATFTGVGVQ